MAVEAYLPTLGAVVVTAAVDAINPCAIGVLILMLSVVVAARRSTARILMLGLLYIGAVFLAYLLAGIGLLYSLASLPLITVQYITLGVSVLVIFAGILEIKDYFWYGIGISLSIPPYFAEKIHKFAKRATVPGVILLGAFVSFVELPCTGAPYLAILALLSQSFDFNAFILLVIYNIIFVSPLIVILFLVAFGKNLYDIKQWKQKYKSYMRLVTGGVLIILGWLLMLIANGTINLG
jgi:cytochrome c biogenesis protein CcdA